MSTTGRVIPYITPLAVADGSKVLLDDKGFASLAAATYVFPLTSQAASMLAATMRTDAAIAFTATVECNCAPKDTGPGEVISDWSDVAADGWVQDNSGSTNAVTGISAAGWTVAAGTLTFARAAAAAGAAFAQLFGRAAARYRLKVVVTTPGKLAVCGHGKT